MPIVGLPIALSPLPNAHRSGPRGELELCWPRRERSPGLRGAPEIAVMSIVDAGDNQEQLPPA